MINLDDNFPPPNSIFRGENGECKRADFIIISVVDNKKRIIFIELKKSNSSSEKDIVFQLKGGKCFFEYSKQLIKEFWGKNDVFKDYEYRYVNFKRTGSIRKKPTRTKTTSQVHDLPENFYKISGYRSIQYNQISA